MKNQRNKKIFAWTLTFIWMIVIFALSSAKGSGYRSNDIFYFIERKAFHVIEYFVLLFLFYWSSSKSLTYKKSIILSTFLAFFYGVSDEWHQTFIFGREGTIRDIIIDFIGIILAVILILLFKKWKEKRKKLN